MAGDRVRMLELNSDRLPVPKRVRGSRARRLLGALASLLLAAGAGQAHASAGCTAFTGNFQAQNFGYHGTYTTSAGFSAGDKIVVTVNNSGNSGASYALDDTTTSTSLISARISSSNYTFPANTSDTITVDVNNTGGTLDISWTCNPSALVATTTSVSGTPNPSTYGQSVTATATVGGGSSPTGNVTFTVDGSGATTVALSGVSASFSTSSLAVGNHVIAATYNGDGGNQTSSGSYTQTVNQATQTITFPALPNTPFTSTPPTPAATASSSLAVSYSSGTPGVCTVTSGGTISFVSAGTCTIRADQAGNANYAAASQVQQSFVVAASSSITGTSPTGTGTITASFTGGGATCTFTRAQFIPLTGDPASPPAGTAPAAYVFPEGLFDFATGGCTPGSTLSFTITYPSALPPGAEYWKYGATAADPAAHWYLLPATISGNTATFSITDGGLGDDDLAANGAIVDPGGPGVPPRSIPTLSEWSMILLSGLLALLGMVALRRRGATTQA